MAQFFKSLLQENFLSCFFINEGNVYQMKSKRGYFGILRFIKTICPLCKKLIKTPTIQWVPTKTAEKPFLWSKIGAVWDDLKYLQRALNFTKQFAIVPISGLSNEIPCSWRGCQSARCQSFSYEHILRGPMINFIEWLTSMVDTD